MNIFSLSGIIIIVTNCFLSLLILIKAKLRIHYIWIIFCLNVALWGLGVYKIGLETDYDRAIMWWRIAYIGVINIPVLYAHFIIEFLKLKKHYFLIVLYLLTVLFQILNLLTNLFISDVNLAFKDLYYISNPGVFYNFFVFLFFAVVVGAIVKMYTTIKTSQGNYRRQVIAFLWATYMGYIGGFFAFLPVYSIFIYPVLNIFVGLFPIIITYAILKHQMLDIRFFVQKGILYSILLSIIVAFYVIVILSLSTIIGQIDEAVTFLSGIITVIAGIYGVPIIEKYFRKKTNSLFFKDVYDYSEAVFNISRVLNNNIDIKILLQEASRELKNILKVDLIKFVLLDKAVVLDEDGVFRKPILKYPKELIKMMEDKMLGVVNRQDIEQAINKTKKNGQSELLELLSFPKLLIDKFGVEVIVPIYLEKKLIAILLMGKKKSEDVFTQEDFTLLKTFSYQAGVAIDKARLFDEVKDYSEKLEKKVISRTAKIKGLQEEQRQTIHEIAHGLQTPLTILRSELSALSNDATDNKKIESLEKSIDRISGLIYKMLRLAKLESESGIDDFKELNLSEIFFDLIEGFKIICLEKGIKIENEIEDNVRMKGSQNEIEELIINLVSNSVKYIGDGDKKIKISMRRNKSKILISVIDSGIGIGKEDQAQLFKRFYRAKTKSASVSGTGLGLVIVKKIVERHQGKIKLVSEIGKGTEVLIEFAI